MKFLNKINVQTPESVELEFTLAGIGNRAFALVIDYMILGLAIAVSLILTIFLTYQIDTILDSSELQNTLLKWLWAIEFLIAFAIYVGYFVIFETIWRGQTLGKKKVKIRVIKDDGRSVRIAQSTLRALLRPVDDLFFLGVFFITFLSNEKRIGDLVAGTIVIQEEKSQKNDDLVISNASLDLAAQLKIDAKINYLLPEDYATIREYLQRRNQMLLAAKHQLSRQLAEQIKNIIELETIPENFSHDRFIEAVYFAYQQEFGEI